MPSPPPSFTACPAAMLRAAFTSALPAYPQAVHLKSAWLSRDLASTCPHAEHRWLVYAAGTFSTRPGALSSSRRTSRPQPDREIPRFSPVLAATLRPGRSVPAPPDVRAVPRAGRFPARGSAGGDTWACEHYTGEVIV